MKALSRIEIATELLELVRKDPTAAPAGHLALAAVDVLNADMQKELAEHGTDRIISAMREEFDKIRPDASATEAPELSEEQKRSSVTKYVDAVLRRQVAETLLRRAAGYMQMAELGRDDDGRPPLTIDDSLRATLSGDQREAARKKAEDLRARAIELLALVGPPERAQFGTALTPYAY